MQKLSFKCEAKDYVVLYMTIHMQSIILSVEPDNWNYSADRVTECRTHQPYNHMLTLETEINIRLKGDCSNITNQTPKELA
jgi:hypothetical protein